MSQGASTFENMELTSAIVLVVALAIVAAGAAIRRIKRPAQATNTPDGIASQLPPVRFSLGIITGSRSMNPIGSWLIPGPDDGTVGVDRADVEGSSSFLVLPATHTFIMNRRDVAEEVAYFLRHGRFRREST